ncbi:hypothetical protein GOB93_16905 [Acetobacter musti]|uniref:Uncharacterized protein n=1 Tax=Acetobacter musti TaxID=864732 RepID=A0ABX0JS52_9PROT|nr:hypothetical protein [Acetobacter musti]NHN86303.1 hypothetical protein [Acetobacter musti]
MHLDRNRKSRRHEQSYRLLRFYDSDLGALFDHVLTIGAAPASHTLAQAGFVLLAPSRIDARDNSRRAMVAIRLRRKSPQIRCRRIILQLYRRSQSSLHTRVSG